jgi:hypothetical protein
MEVRSRVMTSEVDVNVLVSIYNQKIAALTNQNILLEAKLQSLLRDLEIERNLLSQNSENLGSQVQKSKKSTTEESYKESEVG